MGLRIAIFGQAPFGRDVTERLADAGHDVVGVYAPPDGGRPDPLAALAEERGWTLFRHKRFRRKGAAINELVDAYRALGAELNVFPFTTVIVPPEIADHPKHRSICFHPSLLPKYRGGAALAWQIMLGETEGGVSVFQVTEGVDEGPLVVQKGGIEIGATDTVSTLYFGKLYELGVEAMVEAVAAIADGSATLTPQAEAGASFQGLVDDEVARIDWKRPARELDRQIRGCDPSPGAHTTLAGVKVRLFDSRLVSPAGDQAPGTVIGLEEDRLMVAAQAGRLALGKVRVGDGKKVPAPEADVPAGARLG
jgi:methionyl-tRNA formyltransferase